MPDTRCSVRVPNIVNAVPVRNSCVPLVTVKSMSSVTLLSVLLAVITRLPPAACSVPPMIVPPARLITPVAVLKTKVLPVLVNVPVRFTVPTLPARLKVPAPVVKALKVPPRFNVPPVTVIAPALLQGPANVERASGIHLHRASRPRSPGRSASSSRRWSAACRYC